MDLIFAALLTFSTAQAELTRGDASPPHYNRGILIVEAGAPTIRMLIHWVEYTLKASVLDYPQNKGINLETMQEIQVFFGDEDVVSTRMLEEHRRPRFEFDTDPEAR